VKERVELYFYSLCDFRTGYGANLTFFFFDGDL